jgi:cytochrome c biogenesis protein CcmG/thiol:disulfide interchange protein DsbE
MVKTRNLSGRPADPVESHGGLVETDRRVATAVIVVSVVAAAAAYLLLLGGSIESDHGVNQGQIAVNFVVNGLDNSRFILRSHRGEPIVIEFMTTWCGTCRSQIKELKRLHEAFNEVVIATIDIDANLALIDLENLVAEKAIPWFVGHSSQLGRTYGIYRIPTIIIVDGEGIIRYRGLYTPFNELQLILQQIQ